MSRKSFETTIFSVPLKKKSRVNEGKCKQGQLYFLNPYMKTFEILNLKSETGVKNQWKRAHSRRSAIEVSSYFTFFLFLFFFAFGFRPLQ